MRRKRPMSTEQAAARRARRAAQSSTVLLGWLWRNYLHKHLWLLLAALFFMTLEGAVLGVLSWIMQPMFDQIFMAGDRGALWWIGTAIMVIFVLRAVATVAQRLILSLVAQRTAADLRSGLLAHLMTLDGGFHQTHPPGYLIQRLQNDVKSVNQVWNALITGAGRDVISLVILMGVAVSIDWLWTLVACVGVPLMVMPLFVVQKFVRRRAREARDLGARMAVRLDEVFHGIVPVKLNRLERYQSRRFDALTDDLVRAEVRAKAGAAALPGMIDLISGLGFLGVLVFGGSQIIDGTKTVGQFMSFFTAIGLAFNPMRRLGAVSGVWQTAAAAIERLKALLETRPMLTSPARPRPAPAGSPDLRLAGVELAYGETRVLDGVTLVGAGGSDDGAGGAFGGGQVDGVQPADAAGRSAGGAGRDRRRAGLGDGAGRVARDVLGGIAGRDAFR